MDLPKKLVYLRKEKGLSQYDVASALNVSRQAISRWESGSSVPSTDNLKCLGELYKVSVDFLLDNEQEKPNRDEECKNKKSIKIGGRVGLLILICIIFSLVIWLTFTNRKDDVGSKQFEELETDEDDNYPANNFTIVW